MPSHHTTRRSRTLVSLLVLGLTLAACGGDGDDDTAAPVAAESAGATEVTIKLVAFTPATIEIDAGTAVTWVQQDPGSHTVTSGEVDQDAAGTATQNPDGRFASGRLATDETFEYVFDEPGTYSYFCELHPATMRGVVEVR